MKPLTSEDDLSKYHEVAIYHWSDKRTAEQAVLNDVFFRILEKFGEEQKWNLHGYFDWDSKRKSTRPGFDFMMEEAHAQKFKLIVCFDLDFLFPGTARETLDIIDKLTKWRIRYCSMMTLLYPFVDMVVPHLTVMELYNLIAKDDFESDPKYSDELVAIRLAERERHSARSKKGTDKRQQAGKDVGRPPRKRDKVMKLLADGHSLAESITEVGASRATGYRAYDTHRKSRSSLKK